MHVFKNFKDFYQIELGMQENPPNGYYPSYMYEVF